MQKIALKKIKPFLVFVKTHPEYFTHKKGRCIVFGKWEQKGYSIFTFGEDISVMYNKEPELLMALEELAECLRKRKTGRIKIRRLLV